MNLIEKLGLENAKVLNGMLQKHAVPESWRIAVINGMWQRSSVGFTHGELRTAIAKHGTPTNKGTDNLSHFDHCTDIRNHISPLTGVIER
ncbi:hypothetical protein [Acinetobacter bohemicus]|uniref:hypothetical protein n=1 Tax=Acinetobacter bohemicus TaxID=1435036 RepID=UPI00192C1E5F|nr:hypothetical protein [Acinetobacter bohemicus]CAD9196833.1 hypothetical protein QAC21B_02997 [Acinetobacter bohemicus]CAD9197265.1 hypothetical protein QAC21B_03436 [Acinetobacter bohemicus]